MTQDSRLSLQGQQDRSKKICTKAEASQRRSLKVTTYPSPQRSKWESSSGFKGIALRQVFERIALRKGIGGLWETPNQTTDGDQDQESRLNEVRLKAQLYRVYRVYIGRRPYQKGSVHIYKCLLGSRGEGLRYPQERNNGVRG